MIKKVIYLDTCSIFSAAEASVDAADEQGRAVTVTGLDLFNLISKEPETELKIPRIVADLECLGGYFDNGEWRQLDGGMVNRPNYPRIQKFLTAAMKGDSGIELVETPVCRDGLAMLSTVQNRGMLEKFRNGEGNNIGDRAIEIGVWEAKGFAFIVSDDGVFNCVDLANKNGYPVSTYATRGFVGALDKAFGYKLENKFSSQLGIAISSNQLETLFVQIKDKSRGNRLKGSLGLNVREWEVYHTKRGQYRTVDGRAVAPALSYCLSDYGALRESDLPARPEGEPAFIPRITKDGAVFQIDTNSLRAALNRGSWPSPGGRY